MEESSSVGFDSLLFAHKDDFLNDVDYVWISDNYFLGMEKPCLTYGFRGICYLKLLMARGRHPTLSIHGIEGAFHEPGDITVIPRKVIGKFSIRIVPNQTPAEVSRLVIKHVNDRWAQRGSQNSWRYAVGWKSASPALRSCEKGNQIRVQAGFWHDTRGWIHSGYADPAESNW